MTTPDTNSPRRDQVDKKVSDDEIQRISAMTGVAPGVVRTFAKISAPENAHLFTTEAATKAFANINPAAADKSEDLTDELQPLTPEQHTVIARSEPPERGQVIEAICCMNREEPEARTEGGETSGESKSTREGSAISTPENPKQREERIASIVIFGAAAVTLVAFIGAVAAIVFMR